METNDATHNTTSIARSYVAVGKEIPMPVARATYAATHAGHLGSSASVAVGTIQPAISPPRRNRDAGRRALSPARVLIWQQWRIHACASADPQPPVADDGDAVSGQ